MKPVDIKMHVNKDNSYVTMYPETTSKQVLVNGTETLSSIIDNSPYVKYEDGKLLARDPSTGEIIDISGGSKYPISPVTSITSTVSTNNITVKWDDPSDLSISVGADIVTLSKWAKSVLVMKEGSAPSNINDGVKLVESTIRNQYSTVGYTVSNLEYNKTYFFKVFCYGDTGAMTNSELSVTSITTQYSEIGEINNLDYFSAGKSMYIKWNDPVDTGGAFWERTVVVRKTGGYPASISDGIIVADYNTSRNKYSTSYLQIDNLTEGDYYYKIFAFGKGGSVSTIQFTDSITLPTLTGQSITSLTSDNRGKVSVKWSDPSDITFTKNGITYTENRWTQSTLVRKLGSVPVNVNDGIKVVETTTRNQHMSNPFQENLTNSTYYYGLFVTDIYGRVVTVSANVTVIVADDVTGSPGSSVLKAGDKNAGFFGEVPNNELITPTSLASTIGFTAGTVQHNDTPWLKFIIDNKVIFVSKKPIRYDISWDQINAVGAVKGTKTIVIGGNTYKVRLMKGALTDPSSTGSDLGALGSEWNRLMLPIHAQAANQSWVYPQFTGTNVPNWGIGYTDADLLTHSNHGNGTYTWCQELYGSSSSTDVRVVRGIIGVSYMTGNGQSNAGTIVGWRPVLELVQ